MRNMRKSPDRAIPVQGEAGHAHVRFLHTVQTTPPVDIYANGELIAQNLSYGNYSDYYHVTPGNVTFTVYPTGSTDDVIGLISLNIPDKSAFTIAGIGLPGKVGIIQIPEANPPISPTKMSFVRFMNIAPDMPPLNIVVKDGPTIFENIGYKDISIYHRMPPGNYTLQFLSSASGLKMLNNLDVTLEPGKIYTVYAFGYDEEGGQHKTVLVPEGMYAADNVV